MAICKKCAGSIKWEKVEGRWMCYDAGTTTDHWDSCSKRRTERIIATGIPFTRKTATSTITGYKTDLKASGIQEMSNTHVKIRGSLYKPSGDCAECCPPWETCSWPCPDAIEQPQTALAQG